MPIWKCECGELHVIGSLKELQKHAKKKVSDAFDLHAASEVKMTCKCKKDMERVLDIFDVWFDSGIAPWASLGYPFMNKKTFESFFPAARVAEAQDQIRGWFYHLIFCAAAVFNQVPAKEICLIGWVLDAKGEKMSKSLGNVILAEDALKKYGADALRFYYLLDVAPYDTQKFNTVTLEKEVMKVLNILWNLKEYYLSLRSGKKQKRELQVEDQWILSRLHSLIQSVDNSLDSFEFHQAARDLSDFIANRLSREYVQMVRDRAAEGDTAVVEVLHECITTVVLLMAPLTPCIADAMFREIEKGSSVHLESFPECDQKKIVKSVEEEMEEILRVMEALLAEREKAKLGIRWPVSSAVISSQRAKVLKKYAAIIEKQINVKKVEFKEGNASVSLDTQLTLELEEEGFYREVVRRIQEMRKKAGLKKDDAIELVIVSQVNLQRFERELKEKVGARELSFVSSAKPFKYAEVCKIRDKEFKVAFAKK